MKVGVLTSLYKADKYLKGFLDQLPKQTLFPDNLQVVMAHNEPSDYELQLIGEFQKKHPGVIKHLVVNPVESLSASWNRCIRNADCDFVAIWNVDDKRTPDSLERQTKCFRKDPNLDVVHGNFIITNDRSALRGKLVDHSHCRYEPKEYTRSMVLGPFFMFRKAICERIGYFDEQLFSGGDFDFAVRLGFETNIGMVPGVLGYFLDEQRGASTRPNSKQPIERTLVELRYNISDKLEGQYIPLVRQQGYLVNTVKYNNNQVAVEELVSNYAKAIEENSHP